MNPWFTKQNLNPVTIIIFKKKSGEFCQRNMELFVDTISQKKVQKVTSSTNQTPF